MPSCVLIPPQDPYVKTRNCFLRATDDDYCAAAVLHELIRLTDYDMGIKSKCGEHEGIVWVTVSMKELSVSLLGSYSPRTIPIALQHLVDLGMIDTPIPPPVGEKRRYHINVGEIHRRVWSGRTPPEGLSITPDTPPKFAPKSTVQKTAHLPSQECRKLHTPPAENCTPPRQFLHTSYNKERADLLEEIEDIGEEVNPIIPFSEKEEKQNQNQDTLEESRSLGEEKIPDEQVGAADLDLEDSIVVFVKNAYSRMDRRGKGLPNLASKAQMDLVNKLTTDEAAYTPEVYRRALLNFLACDQDWLRDKNWSLRTFCYKPSTWESATPVKSRSLPPNRGVGEVLKAPEVAQHPPTRPSAFDAISIWNKNAPADAPQLTRKYDSIQADKLEKDPDLNEELFDQVCKKAWSAIADNPKYKSWMTFEWLSKIKDGKPGWVKVYRGYYDYKPKQSKQAPPAATPGTEKVPTKSSKEVIDEYMKEVYERRRLELEQRDASSK